MPISRKADLLTVDKGRILIVLSVIHRSLFSSLLAFFVPWRLHFKRKLQMPILIPRPLVDDHAAAVVYRVHKFHCVDAQAHSGLCQLLQLLC